MFTIIKVCSENNDIDIDIVDSREAMRSYCVDELVRYWDVDSAAKEFLQFFNGNLDAYIKNVTKNLTLDELIDLVIEKAKSLIGDTEEDSAEYVVRYIIKGTNMHVYKQTIED